MRSIIFAGVGFLLLGQALAAFDTCSSGAVDILKESACCTSTGPTKHRRTSALKRTDLCGDGTNPCCLETAAGGPTVTSATKTANLQCGSNYGDDTRDKSAAITYSVVECGTELCFHVHVESNQAWKADTPNLQIESDQTKLTNSGLGNWEFNGSCEKTSDTTVDCNVPLGEIYAHTGITTLCDETLYVVIATHVGEESGDEATCTSQGDRIETSGNWFMYSTVTFTCPDVCTSQCCCPTTTEEFHTCDIGTAYGYNGNLFHNFNGNPKGPALGPNTCKKWGFYYSLTPDQLSSPLTGDLIVGAGGNDVSKGTDVGDFTARLSGGVLTVTYTLTTGYGLSEVHVYASCTKPASCAPGSFTPLTTSFPATIQVGDCPDFYWLIFHAKVNAQYPLSKPCPTPVM